MTATLRPNIVQQTLESFCKNLFIERDRYRLIVNVDPVGESVKQEDALDVCKEYFKDVIYNFPTESSLAKAVKWVWSQVSADFIFHLEDDWLLTTKLSIDDMIRILNEHNEIACLRLPKVDIPKKGRINFLSAVYNYKGDNHFVTENPKHFGLNPVLIKKNFITQALPFLTDDFNPEKQFLIPQNEDMIHLINCWKYAIYAFPGIKALVVDNGENWKIKNGFRKPESAYLKEYSTNAFTVWEKYAKV